MSVALTQGAQRDLLTALLEPCLDRLLGRVCGTPALPTPLSSGSCVAGGRTPSGSFCKSLTEDSLRDIFHTLLQPCLAELLHRPDLVDSPCASGGEVGGCASRDGDGALREFIGGIEKRDMSAGGGGVRSPDLRASQTGDEHPARRCVLATMCVRCCYICVSKRRSGCLSS